MSVPVSPLFSVEKRPVAKTNPKGNTQTLSNSEANKSLKSQEVAHSGHMSEKSKHYHARIVGTNTQRAVDELNPTTARPNARSFPGLANG
jgi:hypothetical protein